MNRKTTRGSRGGRRSGKKARHDRIAQAKIRELETVVSVKSQNGQDTAVEFAEIRKLRSGRPVEYVESKEPGAPRLKRGEVMTAQRSKRNGEIMPVQLEKPRNG